MPIFLLLAEMTEGQSYNLRQKDLSIHFLLLPIANYVNNLPQDVFRFHSKIFLDRFDLHHLPIFLLLAEMTEGQSYNLRQKDLSIHFLLLPIANYVNNLPQDVFRFHSKIFLDRFDLHHYPYFDFVVQVMIRHSKMFLDRSDLDHYPYFEVHCYDLHQEVILQVVVHQFHLDLTDLLL